MILKVIIKYFSIDISFIIYIFSRNKIILNKSFLVCSFVGLGVGWGVGRDVVSNIGSGVEVSSRFFIGNILLLN